MLQTAWVPRIRLMLAMAVLAVSCLTSCTPDTETTPALGVDVPATASIFVMGDWGSGTRAQRDVAEAMEAEAHESDPFAILTTGDNFYSSNAPDLMRPYGWTDEKEIEFLVTWGNHDVETESRIETIIATFDDPPRWVIHKWGRIEILVLDSNQVDSEAQFEFILEAIDIGDDPVIVVFHHPPYSCGSHGDTPDTRDTWVRHFDEDVFLVLNGHEHNYQRFEQDGITYVVTGGGGQGLTKLRDCPDDHPTRLAGESSHHFVVLRQEDGQLISSAVDASGTVIDQTTLDIP